MSIHTVKERALKNVSKNTHWDPKNRETKYAKFRTKNSITKKQKEGRTIQKLG